MADLGRIVQLSQLLAPAQVGGDDERVQELFEPLQLPPAREDDAGNGTAIDLPVRPEYLLAEALHDGPLYVGILAQEHVHDVVARDDRGPLPLERMQKLALPGPDSSRDRPRRRGGS